MKNVITHNVKTLLVYSAIQSMFCPLFSLFTFEFNHVLSFPGSACYYAEVNKIDRPNTTPTVRAICTLDLPFIFRLFDFFVPSLLFMKGILYCVIRRKLEPLHVIGPHDSACCYLSVAFLSLTPL